MRRTQMIQRHRLTLLAGMAARSCLLACSLLMIEPVTAVAGPKEDAFQVVEQFKSAFDASDVQRIVKLFAPDASFLGTVSPKLITKTEDVDAYFQGIKTNVPRKITIGEYSTLVLSDTAVVFAGFDVFGMTKEGQAMETPARFTFVITKGDQGWRISHFHSSLRPNPQ
jgi:uncharacterized protein (TIGR02246 family)